MKKRIMAGIMATMMVLTMMQTTAFAKSEETNKPSTETICEVSDDTTELSSQEEGVESGGKPGEADASFDTEDEQHAKTEDSSGIPCPGHRLHSIRLSGSRLAIGAMRPGSPESLGDKL